MLGSRVLVVLPALVARVDTQIAVAEVGRLLALGPHRVPVVEAEATLLTVLPMAVLALMVS